MYEYCCFYDFENNSLLRTFSPADKGMLVSRSQDHTKSWLTLRLASLVHHHLTEIDQAKDAEFITGVTRIEYSVLQNPLHACQDESHDIFIISQTHLLIQILSRSQLDLSPS